MYIHIYIYIYSLLAGNYLSSSLQTGAEKAGRCQEEWLVPSSCDFPEVSTGPANSTQVDVFRGHITWG